MKLGTLGERGAIILATLFFGASQWGAAAASADVAMFKLGAQEAETLTLKSSSRLKAFTSDEEAATEQAGAQFVALLPRLSLEGGYTYLGTVPQIPLSVINPNAPAGAVLPFGANSSYSIGPVLRYTVWDTFSSLKSYHSSTATAGARAEDRRNTEVQLLLAARMAYISVQLALEELRLVDGSLELSRAQDADIATRFRAGAASRLDRVSSERGVIGYELQFAQRQADLSSDLKDLLALTGQKAPGDLTRPGPPGVQGVGLVLDFDSLSARLAHEKDTRLAPPDDQNPQLHSLELQAQASDFQADSQSARQFPTLQLLLKTSLDYPNGPVLQQINQNTVGVTLSMPLLLGDPSRHQTAEKRREADSARYRKEQLRVDLNRDFAKAREVLGSLWERRELASHDVEKSEEAAKLYYVSYREGKSNILDVQNANIQELQSKVNAARLDAQILSQLATLKALSAKEFD